MEKNRDSDGNDLLLDGQKPLVLTRAETRQVTGGIAFPTDPRGKLHLPPLPGREQMSPY
jgi:hypothetical protein